MATSIKADSPSSDAPALDRLSASDVDPIFRPKSVAVIGASRQKHSIGWEILHNMLSCEFQGEVAAVNPSGRVVHSLHCYATVEEVPGPVDLAILVVPSRYAVEAAESCGRKGVRGLVVVTAGFKEVGEAGAALERDLLAVVRKYQHAHGGPQLHGRHQHRSGRQPAGHLLGHAAPARQHRVLVAVGRTGRSDPRSDA